MADDEFDDFFHLSTGETGAARATDPETSHDAAESVEPSALHSIIVETLMAARTGLTTHEIAANCGIGYQTITPRMTTMRKRELVYDTGLRRTWHGAPGSPATTRYSIVWQLTALRDVPIPPTPGTITREELRAKPRRKRDYTRRVKLRKIAEVDRKVGEQVTLAPHTYTIVRIDETEGLVYLLRIGPLE